MRIILVALVISLSLLSGCEESVSSQSDATIQQLKAKLYALEQEVRILKENVAKSQLDLALAKVSLPQESVLFDPQDAKAYQPVIAPAGPILLVLEKVEPYLDGFIVSLRLGNPSSAGYTGVKGTVKWGKKYDEKRDGIYNKLEEKEFDVKDFIPSGAWTVVKFNIAPAKAEDVRRIIITPQFNTINLKGPFG